MVTVNPTSLSSSLPRSLIVTVFVLSSDLRSNSYKQRNSLEATETIGKLKTYSGWPQYSTQFIKFHRLQCISKFLDNYCNTEAISMLLALLKS